MKEYNNIEPILRARTKEDDTAKIVYEPDSFDILANKIAVASAGGSVENIDDLKRLKDKQDFAVLTAQLPTLALTGAMPVTALAGFAGLQQLKNLIVTKAKGEKYSPMQIRMLTEMLPEDTNDYIKLGASLLEAVGDTAVIGAGVNKFKKTLLTDAVNNTIDKLKNAGYKITAEQEQLFKTAVNKRVESINPDDAVAINIKTKMAKIPKNKANMETDINKNNFIEVAGDIADRYKNHNNIKITKEQVNKDFNNLIKIENIVKNTKANIKLTGKELLPVENKNIDYDLNDVDVVRNLAKQYYKDNLQEGKYYLTRPEIDGKIYFTGRQKFFSANNKNIEALKMLPMVKEIIEKGKVLPFSNIVPGVLKKANKNVIGYYFITDVVEQNGINKLVTISLEKDKFGNYFYNLNNGVIDTLKKKLGKSFNPDLESGVHFPSADIIGQNNDGVNDNINYNDTVENITKQIANTEDDIARQMIEKDVPNSYGITDDVVNVKGNNYEDLGINIGGKGNNKKINVIESVENGLKQDEILQKKNCPITRQIDSVQITTTSGVKKWIDLHKKAKAGDLKSAYELVDKIFDTNGKSATTIKNIQSKIKALKALKEKYPNAVIVPLWSIEKTGKNKIPLAYAGKVRRITGLKLYDKIKQINKTHHTDAKAMDRIIDKAIFSGEVVPDLEYIIVDDIITMGANINELRKYIERNGGKVVATSCLGAGQGGANIGNDKNAEMLYNKFSKGAVDDYVRKNKIAESARELTELQARQLIQQAIQSDNSRGSYGDGQRNGRVESFGEITGSEILRGRVTEKTLAKLNDKLGRSLVDSFFWQEGLANTTAEFTTEQAKYLSKFTSLQSIKTKADEIRKKIQNEEINNNSIKSYSLATNKTNIKIKDNEKPNMSDFKLYQRTYDLAKKYMVGNIAESKYRPKNNLGIYYNYGSRKGNIYINSLLNVDVVAHELVHAIDDNLHIITELYNKGFKAETTVKGKKTITTFVPDISIPEGQVIDELLKATKDLYPVDISKKSVKSRLAEGLATLIQYSIINPDMIENFYPNAYKWAMSNDTLKSFRNDARHIIVDYESLNPVKKLTSEIYDKAQEIKEKTKVPLGVRIDSQLFDSEAVYRMLDKDLYLTAKGYRTVLRGILENNLTNENGKMYIIDNHGNPVKVSDSVNWRTLIEDVQKAQSEFNGYLVARRFVAWYDKRDKIVNELMILGDNLKKIQQRYNEVDRKIKNNDFYNMDDLKAGYENERKLKLEMDKLTRQIEQESEKLQKLQNILIKSGKNEQNIKDAYKVLNNTQNIELAKKYDFLMKCNLTVLRTAKLIDKDMYNELVDNFGYAPFNHTAYNELTGEDKEFVKQIGAKNDVVPKIVSSNWNIKNLKEIKGSDLPILSPLYSSIQLMKEAYKKSYKQIVANRMGEIAELYPELMQKVPYKAGDEKNNSVLVVVGTDKATGKEIKQTLEMDPFIKKVWENLVDNYKMSGWEKLMIVPAKFFTLMTTAENPIFAVTNFLRDQITASVNSDMEFKPFFTPMMVYVKSRQNPVVKQYFDEYNELFGESNTYLSNLDEVNPDDLAKAFKTNAWWKIFGFGKKLLSFLPNLSEMVTRRTEYVKARGAGFDIITAKRLADEVSVPFVDRGFWGGKAGRAFLRSVPYMNAGLQVIRQGLRSILATKGNDLLRKTNGSGVYEYKEKNKFIKTLFAMVGLGVMQTAVSLWWDYIDDRTRKNLKRQLNPAQFLRFAYLPWGFNDTDLLRVPWEQLYSFPAVIGAMIYDEMKNDYDYKLSEYAEVLTGGGIPDNFNIVVPVVKSIFEGDNSGWEQLMYRDFPQIVKIGLMLGGGKKTYPTLQDIVPKYLQKREKAMQYDEKTSNLAKFLGWHFKIAPIKLDYYIYNVAGQVGSMFEKGGEFAIDKLTSKTQTGFVDFFTGNVTEKEKAFRKTVMPWLQESYFMYGREMQQFYEEKEKIEALEKSYKEGLRKLSSKELSYVSFNTPHIKTITNKIKQYNKFVKNATDSRNKLTFKQQKNNEQIKIKMENEIIDLVHKWKRAVKKVMKEVA